MRTKVCLFDWNGSGHHAGFIKAFAKALGPVADVVVVAPDETLSTLDGFEVERDSLGDAKPRAVGDADSFPEKEELAERELDLATAACGRHRPDHLVLMWGDPVLRWLLRRPAMKARVSLHVQFAPLHFPLRYRTRLTAGEITSAVFKEALVARWLRRPDSQAIFAIDPFAARRWERYGGRGSALHMPEPPLSALPPARAPDEKQGALVFGFLDHRKGTDRLATALSSGAGGLDLRFLGEVAPEYREALEGQIAQLREGGVNVTADLARPPYSGALAAFADSRCAVLSFGWNPIGSRVLLEAAAAGTPVLASRKGAPGYVVRTRGLGLVADPDSPDQIREAVLRLAGDPDAPARYGPALAAYAEDLDGRAFERTIRRGLGVPEP